MASENKKSKTNKLLWKVIKKNKSYDKRMLKIYYNGELLTSVYPFGG